MDHSAWEPEVEVVVVEEEEVVVVGLGKPSVNAKVTISVSPSGYPGTRYEEMGWESLAQRPTLNKQEVGAKQIHIHHGLWSWSRPFDCISPLARVHIR